jgi:metaxin
MPKIVDGQFTDEEKRQAATLSKLVRKHDNLVKYAKDIFDQWLRNPKKIEK